MNVEQGKKSMVITERRQHKFHRTRRVVDLLIREASFAGIMVNLITGVLMVKLALELGASPIEIGLLGAFPFLGQVLQLPSVLVATWVKSRKWTCLTGSFFYRLAILALIFVPLLEDKALALKATVGVVAVMNFAAGWSAGSWNGWVRDLVHVTLLGRVFGRRLNLYTLFGTLTALLASFAVDYAAHMEGKMVMYTFSALFALSLLASLGGMFYLLRLPDVPAARPEKSMIQELLTPLRDKNFRRLIGFLLVMMFSMNLAVPFFPAYMLDVIGLPVTYVMGLWALGQFMQVPFFKWWGFVADKFSHTTSLAVCLPFFVIGLLLWPLTTMPEPHMFTLPLLIIIHLFIGVGLAGVLLSSQVIALKLAPRKQATSYVAAASMLSSISAGVASVLGGFMANSLMGTSLNINFEWLDADNLRILTVYGMSGYDFLFVFAALLIVAASPLLATIVEQGKAPPQVVRDLMMHRAVGYFRTATTVPGWRNLMTVPIGFLGRKMLTRDVIAQEEARGIVPVEEMIEKAIEIVKKDK